MSSMSYVSTGFLPRCFRMCDVYTAYQTCRVHVRDTNFKRTRKKRSTLAYGEYELRIEEYQLRILTYVRRTRDVPFVS